MYFHGHQERLKLLDMRRVFCKRPLWMSKKHIHVLAVPAVLVSSAAGRLLAAVIDRRQTATAGATFD
jgi:hypothetical protein